MNAIKIIGAKSEFYEVCPQGASTRYGFVVSRFPMGANLGELGWMDRSCAFIFLTNTKRGYLFEDNTGGPLGGFLSRPYVMEKLGVGSGDVSYVLSCLGEILNREI